MSPNTPQGVHHRNDEAAVKSGFEGFKNQTTNKQKSTRQATKTERILRLFYDGRKWNFQSIREHGDSCLHSTVSTLRHLRSIEIDDEPHVVRGFGGHETRCKNYWLRRTPENLKRVRQFLRLSEEIEQ